MIRHSWGIVGLMAGLALAGCNQQAAAPVQPLSPSASAPDALNAAGLSAVPQEAASAVTTAAGQAASALPATGSEIIGGPIEIQTALANAGYYTGPIDGKIGPMTRTSIEEFQRANGLTADGKVGTKTWTSLRAFLAAPSSSAPSSSPQ